MHRTRGSQRRVGRAFTLIELLMVVSIISLLISILLPSLAKARAQAKASVCLNNLKQVGIGLTMYVLQNNDRYPKHSSLKSETTALGKPRTRWPDYLYPYMASEKVYLCPSLSPLQRENFQKKWAHNPASVYGGYGYNFQYLGNARISSSQGEWSKPFHANTSAIKKPSMTVAVADTRGSKKGSSTNPFGIKGAAVYVVDPPLGSKDLGSKGARKGGSSSLWWYEGGSGPGDEELWRSSPDTRHNGKVNVTFCDGHAERMNRDNLDGRSGGRNGSNRYYNGLSDPTQR